MKFKPIRDIVLIKRETQEVSKGGIILPSTTSDSKTFFEGMVLATGDGILTESGSVAPLRIKTGDRVMFSKSGCIDIKLDDDNFLVMREENILGIIET
jgi:chaperonin GroES